jgi:hypothetical protein
MYEEGMYEEGMYEEDVKGMFMEGREGRRKGFIFCFAKHLVYTIDLPL